MTKFALKSGSDSSCSCACLGSLGITTKIGLEKDLKILGLEFSPTACKLKRNCLQTKSSPN
jgi:hypothetical protein